MTDKQLKRKGFTLVELLIVVIIIGIIAGMMMMSAGSASDKAQASKIVANLRTLKSAALILYVSQTNDQLGSAPTNLVTSLDGVIDSQVDPNVYKIERNSTTGRVAVSATGEKLLTSGVKSKLKGMAEASSLYGDPTDFLDGGQSSGQTVDMPDKYDGGDTVSMIVRK